jgi:hypothetical protein
MAGGRPVARERLLDRGHVGAKHLKERLTRHTCRLGPITFHEMGVQPRSPLLATENWTESRQPIESISGTKNRSDQLEGKFVKLGPRFNRRFYRSAAGGYLEVSPFDLHCDGPTKTIRFHSPGPDIVGHCDHPRFDRGSGKNLVFQAARHRSAAGLSRPSNTAARTVATQCAPRGDQRMRCFLAMRALAISSTQPSAREVEIGSLER